MHHSPTSYDSTTPRLVRIYDYLLDGAYHFPVDREVARQIKHASPAAVKALRLSQQFRRSAQQRLLGVGLRQVLDLEVGLPLQAHLSAPIAPDVRIVRTSRDPETTALAHAMTGHSPHIRYVSAPPETIEPILDLAEQHFDGERRVGIVLVGVVEHMRDADLQRVCQQLYDWAAPGSLLAVATSLHSEQPHSQPLLARYDQLGSAAVARSTAQLGALLGPWRTGGALQPLEQRAEQELRALVALPHERGLLGYGGIFRR